MKDPVDLCPRVPADNRARIQEAHIPVGHILRDLVEARIAKPPNP